MLRGSESAIPSSPEMQERHWKLSVLVEDMPASKPILQMLWNTNMPESRRTARHFIDHSLAQNGNDEMSLRMIRSFIVGVLSIPLAMGLG